MYREQESHDPAPSGPVPTIFEAIVRQRCIAATYNRAEVVLAPHVIYIRDDAYFVDAVTISRAGKPPRDTRLGTFKLDGLGGLRLTEREFVPNGVFVPSDPKYAGNALMAVEAA